MKAVDKFRERVEEAQWKSQAQMMEEMNGWDSVHPDGFYIVDVNIHRLLTLVEFTEVDEDGEIDEEGEVEILWVGTHDEYEREFGNNKDTVTKWLRLHGRIEC